MLDANRGQRVLIIGSGVSATECAERTAVCDALEQRRVTPLVFDTSRMFLDSPISLMFGERVESAAALASHHLEDVSAIWRFGYPVVCTRRRLTATQARVAAASSEISLVGALDSFRGFVLDPHWQAVRANNKAVQLAVAKRVGFDVPRTLITNKPDEVRAFAAGKPLVVKLLAPQFLLRDEEVTEVPIMFTRPLTERDIADLRGLPASPMIFQERVQRVLEVRVTFVGAQLFPAAVNMGGVSNSHVDWRQDGLALQGLWQPYELPSEIVALVKRMIDELGIGYGAFDFIVTPDERHVFLEVNPYGGFAFLGPSLRTQVADAIADKLTDPRRERV